MMPGEAPAAIRKEVEGLVRDVNHKVMGKAVSVSNALRNSEIEVLTNPSPSSPGNPPGIRSGNLRRNWNYGVESRGGLVIAFGESKSEYAGYLQDGTSRMAARPFVDAILEDVEPEVDRIFADF